MENEYESLSPVKFLTLDMISGEASMYDEEVSLWIKEKDTISPSTNIKLLNKIEPGIYTVGCSRDVGLYCKKINPESDELFTFSDSITERLLNEINTFWDKKDIYKENKLMHKRGILLEGYPGNGKTSIITILSNEIIKRGGVVFKIGGVKNLEDYIDFLHSYFRKIEPDTPVITILEDLDQYGQIEMELLDFLDGKTNVDHHIIICTTNDTDSIPDTFLRPSRIDLKIEIPIPTKTTRTEYFRFKGVDKKDIDTLVSLSEHYSLADLKELYICIYLLGYSREDAVAKISSPRSKKSYKNSPLNSIKIGL